MRRDFASNLGTALKAQLDKRLRESNFSDYEGHTAWLKENGHDIPKATLNRYGQKYQAQIKPLILHNDVMDAHSADTNDEITVNAHRLIISAQRVLINLVEEMENRPVDSNVELVEISYRINVMSKATSSIGVLNNSQVANRKYADELRVRMEAKLNEIGNESASGGVNAEFMKRIRTEVLGLE